MPNDPLLAENIITTLGLQDMPDEEKAKLVDRILDVVQKRIMLRLTELLATEDDAMVEQLSNDPQRLFAYLQTKVPNFNKILEDEIVGVKKELLESAQPSA